MAITQISRIQHRRGLQQDLPQLASAELGWSIDQRRLFIGNGTLEEGAPTLGVTEILTEYTDIAAIYSVVNSYTFYGNAAGYSAQSGPSLLAPITRNPNDKLDDYVNVRDFGAKGDSVTNDTAAINRAFQQIYKTGYNETQPLARRQIYFPGGVYVIDDTLTIPPYAKLVGDGISSSYIIQTQGNKFLANLVDSKFQSGTSLGSSSALLPQDIEISGLAFYNSNSSVSRSLMLVDSSSNIKIKNCTFIANPGTGVYPNLITITDTVSSARMITISDCKFLKAGFAISISGTSVSGVVINDCLFDQLSNSAVASGSVNQLVTIGNYFGNIADVITPRADSIYSFGDRAYTSDMLKSGMYLGNYQISKSSTVSLTTSISLLSVIANSGAIIDYTVSNTSGVRSGTINLSNYNATSTDFQDSYAITTNGPNANLFANGTHILASVDSGTATATLKYNFRRFV